MWRGDEENPFHTEVGYWLGDGATGEVMRCFVVPRGITTFDGEWSYDETTMLAMDELPDLFPHTDHNTLRPA
jgi:hypothetical protein